MKKFFALLLFISLPAYADQPCIWFGNLTECLPSAGILMDNAKIVKFSELTSNGTDYVSLRAPDSVTTSYGLTMPALQGGAGSTFVNNGSGVLSWGSAANLAYSASESYWSVVPTTIGGAIDKIADGAVRPPSWTVAGTVAMKKAEITSFNAGSSFGMPSFIDFDETDDFETQSVGSISADVSGNLSLNGVNGLALGAGNATYVIPSTDGVSGEVLTTNGNGALSWTMPATFFSPGTVAQVTQIVTVADVAASLNNTYFNLYNVDDATHYVFWVNVSGGGADPAVGGTTSEEIDISTGDSAATVASAVMSAIGGTSDFAVSISGHTLTVRNGIAGASYGASTAASDGAVPTGFAITTPTAGSITDLSAACSPGLLRYDLHYIYICTATNTWVAK